MRCTYLGDCPCPNHVKWRREDRLNKVLMVALLPIMQLLFVVAAAYFAYEGGYYRDAYDTYGEGKS